MKKLVVLQSNYIPWIGYFDLIAKSDIFIFYDEVKFTKNDWRNRNRVRSQSGTHWINIQVCKSSEKKIISDVTLDFNPDWRKSHISLLDFCYAKAPFYKSQLKPMMLHFLNEFQTNNLSELNQYIIKFLAREMKLDTHFQNSKEFQLSEGKHDRLLGLLERFAPCDYISGPAGKNYLDGFEEAFSEKQVKIQYYSYPKYQPYGERDYGGESILDFLAYNDIKNFKDYLGTAI